MSKYAKAILGGLIAFVGAVAVGYTDGAMTAAEWWTSAGAGIAALGGVFGIRNAPTAGEGDGEDGAVDALVLIAVATLIGVVLILFGVRLN
jgi:hypothetical protein